MLVRPDYINQSIRQLDRLWLWQWDILTDWHTKVGRSGNCWLIITKTLNMLTDFWLSCLKSPFFIFMSSLFISSWVHEFMTWHDMLLACLMSAQWGKDKTAEGMKATESKLSKSDKRSSFVPYEEGLLHYSITNWLHFWSWSIRRSWYTQPHRAGWLYAVDEICREDCHGISDWSSLALLESIKPGID